MHLVVALLSLLLLQLLPQPSLLQVQAILSRWVGRDIFGLDHLHIVYVTLKRIFFHLFHQGTLFGQVTQILLFFFAAFAVDFPIEDDQPEDRASRAMMKMIKNSAVVSELL